MKNTILLVDDEAELLEVLSEELNEKYHIVTAQHGAAALQVLEKEPVQLVVSDVMMEVMDGFELCRRIKSSFEYSHIPVILLTAKNTLQSKIAGLELGADAYIEKPFDIDLLFVQIANLLANRDKLRNYFVNSPVVQIKTIAHTRSDEVFLEKLTEAIVDAIDDPSLDVDRLAVHMNMSRTTLFRKIKAVADITPNEVINLTRLKKAAELLTDGNAKIFEVAYKVGYNSQTNFGRNFSKQFGMTPTQYQKANQTRK
ncbi:response regulator transcription factor [Cnuella takakiae]|nr:DNA-binding response regulator [Cnuella takakiae]OLY94375.1 two-component system response regulator [Cnuella takakiae]